MSRDNATALMRLPAVFLQTCPTERETSGFSHSLARAGPDPRTLVDIQTARANAHRRTVVRLELVCDFTHSPRPSGELWSIASRWSRILNRKTLPRSRCNRPVARRVLEERVDTSTDLCYDAFQGMWRWRPGVVTAAGLQSAERPRPGPPAGFGRRHSERGRESHRGSGNRTRASDPGRGEGGDGHRRGRGGPAEQRGPRRGRDGRHRAELGEQRRRRRGPDDAGRHLYG